MQLGQLELAGAFPGPRVEDRIGRRREIFAGVADFQPVDFRAVRVVVVPHHVRIVPRCQQESAQFTLETRRPGKVERFVRDVCSDIPSYFARCERSGGIVEIPGFQRIAGRWCEAFQNDGLRGIFDIVRLGIGRIGSDITRPNPARPFQHEKKHRDPDDAQQEDRHADQHADLDHLLPPALGLFRFLFPGFFSLRTDRIGCASGRFETAHFATSGGIRSPFGIALRTEFQCGHWADSGKDVAC